MDRVRVAKRLATSANYCYRLWRKGAPLALGQPHTVNARAVERGFMYAPRTSPCDCYLPAIVIDHDAAGATAVDLDDVPK